MLELEIYLYYIDILGISACIRQMSLVRQSDARIRKMFVRCGEVYPFL